MSRAQKQPRPPRSREETRQRWFWISIPLGVVVGVAAGLGLWNWQLDREQADLAERARLLDAADAGANSVPPPGEELRALVAQDERVRIDPSVADQISAEQRAQAEAILQDSGKPLHLAFMRKPEFMYDGYTQAGAVATWVDAVGEDGHYVMLWTGGRADVVSVGFDDEYLWEEAEGQPGPALVRVAEAMTEFSLDDTEDDAPLTTRDDRDYWGGPDGGVGLALLLICFVVLPIYAVVYNVILRRPARPPRPGRTAGER